LQRFHDSAFQFLDRFLGILPRAPARHTANYRHVEMIAITLSIAWLAAEPQSRKAACSKYKKGPPCVLSKFDSLVLR